jgi:pimeloyl-ACP methyl ester carboxylesterase
MPGRGRSDWLQNKLNYNYNTYQIVATTLLARLQAPVIDWVGISMGGILGMKLAALPSCPIRKLVLIDIGAFVPKDSLVRIGTYLGKEPLFRSVDEYKVRMQYYIVHEVINPLNRIVGLAASVSSFV